MFGVTKFVFFLDCKAPRASKGSSLDHSHVAIEMKMSEKTSTKLKQVLHLCIHLDMKRYYTESTWLHCTQIFPTPPLQGTLCHCNLKLARLDHLINVYSSSELESSDKLCKGTDMFKTHPLSSGARQPSYRIV